MWRNSALPIRLGPVDWRAIFPLLLFFMHIRWWTFFTAIGAIVFFVVLEHFGWTVPVAARTLRVALAGTSKRARPWWLLARLREPRVTVIVSQWTKPRLQQAQAGRRKPT